MRTTTTNRGLTLCKQSNVRWISTLTNHRARPKTPLFRTNPRGF